MSRETQFFVRVTEHHVVKNPLNSSNNSDGNVITFVENFTHDPGGFYYDRYSHFEIKRTPTYFICIGIPVLYVDV